jgi:hypothetical protein
LTVTVGDKNQLIGRHLAFALALRRGWWLQAAMKKYPAAFK